MSDANSSRAPCANTTESQEKMGRKKLEEAGPPGSAARLRVELTAADWIISIITWGSAAGVIVWSMLNATPYVRAHVTPGWEDTAFVLPVVVDLAFVGSLRADEIASRYGASGGKWAGALRLFTGGASLFLNVGHSAENGDWTGVAQHLIAPGILVLVAEAGPAYRRRLSNRLTEVELEEAEKTETARKERDQEDEHKRKLAQEEADRKAESDRQEAERQRLQRLEDEERQRRQRREDEERALDLEERRETGRAKRDLDARRLDLEEKRLTTPAPVPAAPVRVPVAPVVSAPRTGVAAPQARTEADHGPAVAWKADTRATTPQTRTAPPVPVSAARTAPPAGRISVPVDVPADHQAPAPKTEAPAPAAPQRPAAPPKDWEREDLPADCAPGIAPALLTDQQSRARIRYGLAEGWTQRRIGEFAGRSATTVNKLKASL